MSREETNLNNPADCKEHNTNSLPDCVINAAAYTSVDEAEFEKNLAVMINGHAPEFMAMACKEPDIPFIHLSTDYVFNGNNNVPWKETDKPDPINAYGHSKLIGENKVQAISERFVVLRTARIFSSQFEFYE